MTTTQTMRLLGTSAFAALLPALAPAQEIDISGAVDLGEIVFTVLGADPVGDRTNPFTLTGVKTATPITEVPQSVSVVSAEDIDSTNAAKIDEALGYTVGVQSAPYAYDSDTNWFLSRGYDATQTGVFLDGLQLYSFAFGSFYVDPFLVERVEVLRGPSSMLYGASNPGGVLNYVSRLPGGAPGTLVELGADSEGRRWASVDTGGTFGEDLAYRFGVKAQQVDGHGMFEPGFHGIATGGLAYRFDNGGVLTVTASYTSMDEDHVGGAWLPYYGAVEDVGLDFPRYFNSGEPGYDDYSRDQVLATAIYRQQLGEWTLTNTARYASAEVAESSVYAYGYSGFALTPQDPDFTLSRIFFEHDSHAESLHNDLRLERTLQIGGTSHELLFGVDAKYYSLDQVQGSVAWPDAATGLSASDPVYGAAQPATTPYIDQELAQTKLGIYAQDQIRWGDGWIATLNARYDMVHTEAGGNAATGVAGVDREDNELSWRTSLARTFGDVTPYVTAGTYFNPQVVNDPAGDDVAPETGRLVEAGVKWAPDERTLVTLAAFQINRENISQDQWNGAGYDYFQIAEVRSRGIELEARGVIADGLSYRGALTLLDVEIVDDIDPSIVGNTPYTVQEQMSSFAVDWQPARLEGLTLTGGVRYLGESWADNQNTLPVPDTLLFDAGSRYDFAGGYSVNLDVSNLLDEAYITSCQTAYWCYSGEGRNVSLAVQASF